MATGGDIVEMRFNHPTLGTGVFYPKSGEDSTFEPGGIRNNDDANSIDGSGQPIYTKTRIRGSIEATIRNDQNTDDDINTAIALATSPIPAVWTITVLNNTVWKITGMPVGDLQANIGQATFTLKIAGGIIERV